MSDTFRDSAGVMRKRQVLIDVAELAQLRQQAASTEKALEYERKLHNAAYQELTSVMEEWKRKYEVEHSACDSLRKVGEEFMQRMWAAEARAAQFQPLLDAVRAGLAASEASEGGGYTSDNRIMRDAIQAAEQVEKAQAQKPE